MPTQSENIRPARDARLTLSFLFVVEEGCGPDFYGKLCVIIIKYKRREREISIDQKKRKGRGGQ